MSVPRSRFADRQHRFFAEADAPHFFWQTRSPHFADTERALLRGFPTGGHSILEVGCGTGNLTLAAVRRLDAACTMEGHQDVSELDDPGRERDRFPDETAWSAPAIPSFEQLEERIRHARGSRNRERA